MGIMFQGIARMTYLRARRRAMGELSLRMLMRDM
jgi:hypothetical protein